MISIQHPYCNDILKCPPGTEGSCKDLHILRQNGTVVSFWMPDKDEVKAILSGQPIFFQCAGNTHPPMTIGVLAPPATQPQAG